MSCAALTLLYQIVPDTHVNWRAALGGGLAAGTLWELSKLGFTWASTRLFRYGAVYGSLGALPVFLLWLQVGWVIVLLGCKVAYGLQNARALREERTQLEVSGLGRELLGLRCMLEVARAFLKGEPAPSAETLAAGTMSALGAEQEVLNRLTEAGLRRRPRRSRA
jgi:membrane protein